MAEILVVGGASLMGGVVQAVTGFGGAVIIMIFLPLLLSMTAAPAVSDVITMTLSFSMMWRYRKWIRWRAIALPAIIYLAASSFVIHWSGTFHSAWLKGLFGVFLIVLALYFWRVSGKMKVTPSFGTQMVCGGLAGICGGLFGISGPPASLYYLAATEAKEEYLGTLNAFFSVTVVFNLVSRAVNGFLTAKLIPYIVVGVAAILAGCGIGSRIVMKIDIAVMRKCVYGLMAFAGIVALAQAV